MKTILQTLFVIASVIILFSLLSCSSQGTQLHKTEPNTDEDDTSSLTNGVKYEKYKPFDYYDFALTDDTTNFEKELVSLLVENSNQSKFKVDSLLVEGVGGDWYFWQGHLFSKNHEHGIVFINGAEFPIFIFEKIDNEWKSIMRVEYPRPLSKGETIQIKDFNFDGIMDLGINHGDFGGHFSCSNCFKILLYNEKEDKFTEVDEFKHYIDVQFDSLGKAVYLGNHGYESTFYKCQWKGMKLIPKEIISFSGSKDEGKGGKIYSEEHDIEFSCSRRHYKVIGNKKLLIRIRKTCHLPDKWEKIFKFQEHSSVKTSKADPSVEVGF